MFPSNVGVVDDDDNDDGASENVFFGVQKAAEALEEIVYVNESPRFD